MRVLTVALVSRERYWPSVAPRRLLFTFAGILLLRLRTKQALLVLRNKLPHISCRGRQSRSACTSLFPVSLIAGITSSSCDLAKDFLSSACMPPNAISLRTLISHQEHPPPPAAAPLLHDSEFAAHDQTDKATQKLQSDLAARDVGERSLPRRWTLSCQRTDVYAHIYAH